jgi:hypothetical protein
VRHRVCRVSVSQGCYRTSSSATASYSIGGLAFGLATPVLSVEEGSKGFSDIFEIVAGDEAGDGGLKKETPCV